jgi:hypothetical protein
MRYIVIADEDPRTATSPSEYLGTYDTLRGAAHAIEEHCPLWKEGCPPVVLEWSCMGNRRGCYMPELDEWVGGPVVYRVLVERKNTRFV